MIVKIFMRVFLAWDIYSWVAFDFMDDPGDSHL